MRRLQFEEETIRKIAERNGDYLVNATDLVELFDRINQLEALVPHRISHGTASYSYCTCGARLPSSGAAIEAHFARNPDTTTTDPSTGAFDD
jgi:hypothetical protein